MKRFSILLLLMFAGPVMAAEQTQLPPDVISFNRRSAACHPVGSSQRELLESLSALQKTEKCAALERERAKLRERYKGNRDALNALTLKVGFVSVDVYPAQN